MRFISIIGLAAVLMGCASRAAYDDAYWGSVTTTYQKGR